MKYRKKTFQNSPAVPYNIFRLYLSTHTDLIPLTLPDKIEGKLGKKGRKKGRNKGKEGTKEERILLTDRCHIMIKTTSTPCYNINTTSHSIIS